MDAMMMDPRWALLTLLITGVLGLILALVLMIIVESRSIKKNTKRIFCAVGFLFFMGWLFTLGDPYSSFNLESLYYKSIDYLPDTRFTKFFKKPANTNVVSSVTNGPVAKTNR